MRETLGKRIYRSSIKFVRSGFNLKVGKNGKYGKSDILSVPIFAGVREGSLTMAAETLSLRNGRYRNVPCADDVIYHFEDMHWEDVLRYGRETMSTIITIAKENGDLEGPQNMAIDPHLIPRFRKKPKNPPKRKKKCEDIKKTIRTNQVKGTSKAHKIVPGQVVGNSGRHYILDALPVDQFSEKRDIVRELIKSAKEKIQLNITLMDREYFAVDVINVCREEETHFVIGAIRNDRVKEVIKKAQGKLFHVEEDFKLGDKKRFAIYNLVVVARSALNKKYEWDRILGKDKYFVFATDLKVSTLDDAVGIADTYGERWGIETGHREWEKFRAITCSHLYSVRLFLILLAMIMFNVWMLINKLFSGDKRFIAKFGGYVSAEQFRLLFEIAILIRYKRESLISMFNF